MIRIVVYFLHIVICLDACFAVPAKEKDDDSIEMAQPTISTTTRFSVNEASIFEWSKSGLNKADATIPLLNILSSRVPQIKRITIDTGDQVMTIDEDNIVLESLIIFDSKNWSAWINRVRYSESNPSNKDFSVNVIGKDSVAISIFPTQKQIDSFNANIAYGYKYTDRMILQKVDGGKMLLIVTLNIGQVFSKSMCRVYDGK